jgi:hypothetical protein
MFPAAQQKVNILYLTIRNCFVSVMWKEVRRGGKCIKENVKAAMFGRPPVI